jgi:hypothetical protein
MSKRIPSPEALARRLAARARRDPLIAELVRAAVRARTEAAALRACVRALQDALVLADSIDHPMGDRGLHALAIGRILYEYSRRTAPASAELIALSEPADAFDRAQANAQRVTAADVWHLRPGEHPAVAPAARPPDGWIARGAR